MIRSELNFRVTCFDASAQWNKSHYFSVFSLVTKLFPHVAEETAACTSALKAMSICTEAYFLLRRKENLHLRFAAVSLFWPALQLALYEVTFGMTQIHNTSRNKSDKTCTNACLVQYSVSFNRWTSLLRVSNLF